MPIKVVCSCGAGFAAPDQYAGKKVKCPKCGGALAVPNGNAGGATSGGANAGGAKAPGAAPQAASRPAPAPTPPANAGVADLFELEGLAGQASSRCSKCQASMPLGAVICVACGFNSQTGETVFTTVKRNKGDGHGGAAETVLQKAAEDLAKGPVMAKEQTTGGVLAGYVLSVGLLVVAVVAMGLAYLGFMKIESSGNSQYYAGLVMGILGTLMGTVSAIVLIVKNFKSGLVHGLCSIFVPFYAPIYGALSGQGFWAFLWVMGMFFQGVGTAMFWYFSGERTDGQTRLPPRPAAVAHDLIAAEHSPSNTRGGARKT
jgi:hypothetical protein